MKRQKRLTKKERKARDGSAPKGTRHIHCIACGRHLHEHEFTASPVSARYIKCLHGSTFPVCVACVSQGQALLAEHDRTGQPVQSAGAWH
jgi:hypothetical protein